MIDVSREEFAELAKRQDQAEQRDREMSRDIKQIRCDTAEVVETRLDRSFYTLSDVRF